MIETGSEKRTVIVKDAAALVIRTGKETTEENELTGIGIEIETENGKKFITYFYNIITLVNYDLRSLHIWL